MEYIYFLVEKQYISSTRELQCGSYERTRTFPPKSTAMTYLFPVAHIQQPNFSHLIPGPIMVPTCVNLLQPRESRIYHESLFHEPEESRLKVQ